MGSKSKKLQDILNAGIGAVKTSTEVWEKLVNDLNTKKNELGKAFEELKEKGEKDFSEDALKIKMGAAWSIVRFEEIRDNLISFLDKLSKEKEEKKE